jgi:adenylate cyclase
MAGRIPVPRIDARPDARRLRLASGLVLFAHAACHFATHAAGLLLFGAMELANTVLLAPWRLWPGQVLLYGSLAAHAALGLQALWRRRHLAMPATEARQMLLGLAIPVLLLVHLVEVRIAAIAFGIDDSDERMVPRYRVDLRWLGAGLALLLMAV